MTARQYIGLMALMLFQFAAIIYVATNLPGESDPTAQPVSQKATGLHRPLERGNDMPKDLSPSDTELREAIRSVLTQELRPYLDQIALAGTQAAGPVDVNALPGGVTPELNNNAWKQSEQISTQILSKGSWTRGDDAALNAELAKLTPDQQYKVMEKLLSAMERGELLDDRIPRD